MNRRAQPIRLFGISFLDVLFCALGGVLMLLIYSMWTGEQRIGWIGADRDRLLGDKARLLADRDTLAGRNDQLLGENKRLISDKEQLKAEEDRLLGELSELRSQVRGVIALKGEMQNVVFVIDRSESLGREQDAQRQFDECKNLLAAWIETLAFKQFNVVQFNDLADVPPGWQGRLLDATDAHRKQAVQYVQSLRPVGRTNTMGALELALGLPGVDTIILFSDGAPEGPQGTSKKTEFEASERGKEQAAQWIRDYLKEHNRDDEREFTVTISTIAVGNYLDTVYGRFLQKVAKENGGVFIGR